MNSNRWILLPFVIPPSLAGPSLHIHSSLSCRHSCQFLSSFSPLPFPSLSIHVSGEKDCLILECLRNPFISTPSSKDTYRTLRGSGSLPHGSAASPDIVVPVCSCPPFRISEELVHCSALAAAPSGCSGRSCNRYRTWFGDCP